LRGPRVVDALDGRDDEEERTAAVLLVDDSRGAGVLPSAVAVDESQVPASP
jgi:hypothetical protein